MEAPTPKGSTEHLLHYGEILLELDRQATALANDPAPAPTKLPVIRFYTRGHFFRVTNWVLERED